MTTSRSTPRVRGALADDGAASSKPALPRRARARSWFKVLLLVAMLGAVVLWVDLKNVWSAIAGMPPLMLLLALLIATGDRFLMGYKWRQLILAGGERIRIGEAVSAYYQSAFASRVFPIGIGQDVLRAYLASRMGVSTSLLVSSMTLEKLIAILANVLLALLSMMYLASGLPVELRNLIVVSAGLVMIGTLGGLALALSSPMHRFGARLLGNRLPAKLADTLGRASDSLLAYRRRPGVLCLNLLLAGAELFLQFLKFLVLGWALGVALPLLAFAASIMVVLFARRITAYFEGWGLSEVTSIVLFTLLGVDRDIAVALALTNYAVTTVATLPGGYLLYRSGLGLRPWRNRTRH